MTERPQKITFGEMRDMGVRGVVVYCQDYKHSHSTAMSADQWPDDLRLSDNEDRFTCKSCGKRGADGGRTSIASTHPQSSEPRYVDSVRETAWYGADILLKAS